MKKKRRNIGIIAHIDAGKTTLSERFLFYSGREHRMGEVHEGTAKMDWQEEEQERGITITSAATTFPWRDADITLIDTPGHVDFTAEVERSLRVLDGAVGVFSGVDGVEAQSETVWRQADRYRVPRVAFINKLDRVGAEYFRVLAEIAEELDCRTIPMIVPIGREGDFEGIIDLVRMKEVRFDEADLGATVHEAEIAAERREEAEMWRGELLEQVADGSDEVMALFLEGREVPEDTLAQAIRSGTIDRRWVPTFGGAAFRNKGVQPVLDATIAYLPAPEEVESITGLRPRGKDKEPERVAIEPDPKAPFAALIFKVVVDSHGDLTYVRVYAGTLRRGATCVNPREGKKERFGNIYRMHSNQREAIDEVRAGDIVAVTGLRFSSTGDTLCDPARQVHLERLSFPETVISVAVEPRSAGERDRLLEQLTRMMREDPTFRFDINEETGQIVMSGMGELHLEVIRNRLLRDFKVDANVGKPRVSYRQTFSGQGRASAKVERTLGGKEHAGSIVVELEHDPELTGYEVVWREPGELPRELRPVVEQATCDCLAAGGLLGFPYIQVRARLSCPEFTPQTTEVGLTLAVREAIDRIEHDHPTVLLEPVMHFQITTPEEYYGQINQDLVRRRGAIEEVHAVADLRRLEGRVPLSRVFGYTTDLRSMSQGRAALSLEPIGYAPASEEDAARFRV